MRRARAALGMVLLAVAAGCAPAARAPIDSVDSLGGEEMVLVGRIELVPPLRKGEQRIRGLVVGDFENRMFLITDEKPRPLPRDIKLADYSGRIEAPLGSTFFVRSRSAPFHLLGGVLFLEFGGDTQQRAHFPGGMQVAARPGDRAVYIGTLRYHRDEFFEISRVVVVDEYAQASAEYAKKFGTRYPLRKVLLKANGK